MKNKMALLLALVTAVCSFQTVTMAASKNSIENTIGDISVNEILVSDIDDRSIDILNSYGGIDLIAGGTPVSLNIVPFIEVNMGDSIILEVGNAVFDERLAKADPFIFRTKESGTTYDEILSYGNSYENNYENNYEEILRTFVHDENSRELPYGFRYIDENHIEVYLYPIGNDHTNTDNNYVANGTPVYNIPLPITTAGSEEGPVTVYIISNDSSISGGEYNVAAITYTAETTDTTETTTDTTTDTTETTTAEITETTTAEITETTTAEITETTTDEITETTTAETTETTTVRRSSGGGGGGVIIKSESTTTAVTEATTESATAEAVTEAETETTTAGNFEVKVSIGAKNIVVDNRTYSMDASPYIQSDSNSTLVPLRFVAVALAGGNVDSADTSSIILWDPLTKKATINYNDVNAVFTAESNIVSVNGSDRHMDYGVTAEIKDDRMYIPFRALGEILGYNVEWEADTKTAVYKADI